MWAKRLAYEIPADALGPGELYAVEFLGGRLYLSGNVQFKRGWVQLRQLEDGSIVWKLDQDSIPGWVARAIAVGGQIVMCGKDPLEYIWLEARSLANGNKLWSAPRELHDYPPKIEAAGNDKVMVMNSEDGGGTRVTSLNVNDGKANWSVAVKAGLSELVVQKDLVLARTDRRAVAIDLRSGRILSDTVYGPKGANGAQTSRPSGALSGTFTAQERQDMEPLLAAYSHPATEAIGWTVCHCATEGGKARAQKLEDALEAYQEEDIVGFRAGGGAKGVLDSLRKMLDDPDPIMRAFAAIALATAGQQSEKERIARLMKSAPSRPQKSDETATEHFGDIDRCQAAVALGILGAKEYADDIAAMLSSNDSYVRCGAAAGLGLLKASQYAKRVSELLGDENDQVKIGAMEALAMMGADAFADDIAKSVDPRGDLFVTEAACLTLAQMGATKHADRIAALLQNEFIRRDAARALAVLGARQYTSEIAKLLESPSSLDRNDACLALGLLNAKEQEKAIGQRLKDPEDLVAHSAALALVLLDSVQFAQDVVPIFERYGCYGLSDFPLTKDRQSQVETTARKNFIAMKALASTRPTVP